MKIPHICHFFDKIYTQQNILKDSNDPSLFDFLQVFGRRPAECQARILSEEALWSSQHNSSGLYLTYYSLVKFSNLNSGEQLCDLLWFLPRPTTGPVQSNAKEGEDLHGQAAIRLNVADRVDHVDYLDLHGQAAICINVASFLRHVDHIDLHGFMLQYI